PITCWEKPQFDHFQQPVVITNKSADNNEEYEDEELIAQRHYVVFGDQDDLTPLAESNPKQISCAYQVAPLEQEFIKEEVDRMLKHNLIQRSESPWVSLVILVRKKNGKLQFCIDYRKLNSVTQRDGHPLPRIDKLLNMFEKAKYFSTLDLASGYWQVAMDPNDQAKIAFITSQELYEFKVMPFGLTNAPATFQRLMNKIFREEIG
ncbi:19107_t:CDS:2, partial [Funneliformis geosporum]